MTTIVTVETSDHAAHVRTHPMHEDGSPVEGATWSDPPMVVPPQSSERFTVTSGQDVMVHEVQPSEGS